MESKKRHEEKQAKAAELRERFRQEKAERIKDLTKKVWVTELSGFPCWEIYLLIDSFAVFST